MSDVEAKVKDIIMKELGSSETQITPEASFANDLGADSLSIVQLIMTLEDTFHITIDDTESQKIKTVGDAVRFIEEKQKKGTESGQG